MITKGVSEAIITVQAAQSQPRQRLKVYDAGKAQTRHKRKPCLDRLVVAHGWVSAGLERRTLAFRFDQSRTWNSTVMSFHHMLVTVARDSRFQELSFKQIIPQLVPSNSD